VLTNRTPVPSVGTPQEVLKRVQDGVPIPPARQVNPDVHPALEAICRKALAREVGDRYPSAQAVAADVRAYLAGEPVGAYPEPLSARLWRRARRHKAAATAAVAALAAVAVVSTAAAGLVYREKGRTAAREREAVEAREDAERQGEEARRQREEAERQKKQAENNLDISLAVADNLFDLVSATETGSASRNVGERLNLLSETLAAAEKLQALLPDDPARQHRFAQLLRFAGNLARATNDKSAAGRHYAASIAVQRKLIAQHPGGSAWLVELAHTLQDQAEHHVMYGRLADAVARLDEAAAALAGLPADTQTTPAVRRATGMIDLSRSDIETSRGRVMSAESAARRAADSFGELGSAGAARHSHDPLLHALALHQLAQAQREQAWTGDRPDYAAALATHDQSVAALRSAADATPHRDTSHNLYRALAERARTRRLAGGRPADIRSDLDEAVTGWERLLQLEPDLPVYRRNLAVALTARGDPQAAGGDGAARAAAAADLQRARRLLEGLFTKAPDRPAYRADVCETWLGLAELAATPEEARTYYRNAGSSARRASKDAPDNALYRRLVQAAERQALTNGYDTRPPTDRP
jgi:type II secretory pathway pseudopilin PulG